MSKALQLLKGKALSLLKGQLGAVSFEYVLTIGGVSVIAIGLLAIGADVMTKQLLIYVLCEQLDEVIPPAIQWPCEFGGSSFRGW